MSQAGGHGRPRSWPQRARRSRHTWSVIAFGLVALLLGTILTRGDLRFPFDLDERWVDGWGRFNVSPSNARVIASVLLLIGTLVAIRRLRMYQLEAAAGPIVIRPVRCPPEIDAPVSHLEHTFQDFLTHSQLYSPTVIPGSSAGSDLLDVVNDDAGGEKGWPELLARGLASLVPRAAYRVNLACIVRDQSPDCGLIVDVASPLGRGGREVVWDTSWPLVAERAANHVAAVALSYSKRRREAPWNWHEGERVPGELFHHYQRAMRLVADRRFDEALAALDLARRIDPLNVDIRVEIAVLEERLALWMDALESYEAIMALLPGRQGGLDGPDAFHSDQPETGLRLGARLRAMRDIRHRDPYVARYRHAVILGFAEKMVDQWKTMSSGWMETHDQTRTDLRIRLGDRLMETYADQWPSGEIQLRRFFEAIERASRRGERAQPADLLKLEELLARASVVEMDRLERDATALRLRFARSPLTREALLLCRLWSRLRLLRILAESRPEALVDGAPEDKTLIPQLDVPLRAPARVAGFVSRPVVRWRPAWAARTIRRSESPVFDPEKLEPLVRRCLWWHGWGQSRQWQVRYTAACVYALGVPARGVNIKSRPRLKVWNRAGVDSETFARLAIGELEAAVKSGDPETVANKRDWLLADDPDLAGIRNHPSFTEFERVYLPAEGDVAHRPADVDRFEASRYVVHLIAGAASVMVDLWSARLEESTAAGNDELAAWLALEARSWRRMSTLAREHRYWPARADVIEYFSAIDQQLETARFPIPYPTFNEEAAAMALHRDLSTRRKVEDWAHELRSQADTRLRTLHDIFTGPDSPVTLAVQMTDFAAHGDLDDRSTWFRSTDAKTHGWAWLEAWRVLAAWVDDRGMPDGDREERYHKTFLDRCEQLSELYGT